MAHCSPQQVGTGKISVFHPSWQHCPTGCVCVFRVETTPKPGASRDAILMHQRHWFGQPEEHDGSGNRKIHLQTSIPGVCTAFDCLCGETFEVMLQPNLEPQSNHAAFFFLGCFCHRVEQFPELERSSDGDFN